MQLDLIQKLEASGKFSEREVAIMQNSGCSMFGYERRHLMALSDSELADVMEIVAKMLRVGTPFASVARWTAADLYERAFRREGG